jgi:hypothetical protein
MTGDQFLRWISAREERFELEDGIPVPRPEPDGSRSAVIRNVVTALTSTTPDSGWLVGSLRIPVVTAVDAVRFPDVVLRSVHGDGSNASLQRTFMVVEVFPSGLDFISLSDRLDGYAAQPDIGAMLLVETDVVLAKAYRREGIFAGWSTRRYDSLDDVIELPGPRAALAMRDIYRSVEPRPGRSPGVGHDPAH